MLGSDAVYMHCIKLKLKVNYKVTHGNVGWFKFLCGWFTYRYLTHVGRCQLLLVSLS